MIAPRDVLRHEWIGRHVLVVQAKNPSLVGIGGLCVDETKQTLRIATTRGTKCVPKADACFRLSLPDGTTVEVDGAALVGAPERRLTLRR
ncbi:MAG TPA: ribonuclease P protein component 1 [Methanoregulaceae archaeon]|nr:ribonuclease P protein component 1 [Methanoregulaceae archaeon]HQJ88470.1 ribonuclease P protein component 1 [Methanoregulaceae archaeon]